MIALPYRILQMGALALALGLSTSTVAFAQDQDRSSDAIDLDSEEDSAFVIRGTEHMPDFDVFISRENLARAFELDLEERFLPKIIEAIGREPF